MSKSKQQTEKQETEILEIIPEVQDEFSLKENELTKTMLCLKANTTNKTIENWVKAGKITQKKIRRRINGQVKQTVIFDLEEIEQFLSGTGTQEETTALQKRNETNIKETDFLLSSQVYITETLLKITSNLERPNKPQFMTISDASNEFGLSESYLKELIKTNLLTGHKGKKGKVLVSRNQLEKL